MRLFAALLAQLLHIGLVLGCAPLLAGLPGLVAARLAGQIGPPVLQPWRDLLRLVRKQPVVPENASFVFLGAPALCFAATAAAAFLVPSFALGMLFSPFSDLLVIAGLLALGRAALALAAMDGGTAEGGMGASRAMAGAALAEPALLLVILVLAVPAGGSNLDAVATVLREGGGGPGVSLGLALLATAGVGLVANDARGGLAQALSGAQAFFGSQDFSGRHLAWVAWAESLRLLLWFSLLAAIWLPFGTALPGAGVFGWILGLASWAVKMLVLGLGLGCLTGVLGSAGVSGTRVLGMAVLLALLAAVFLFLGEGRA